MTDICLGSCCLLQKKYYLRTVVHIQTPYTIRQSCFWVRKMIKVDWLFRNYMIPVCMVSVMWIFVIIGNWNYSIQKSTNSTCSSSLLDLFCLTVFVWPTVRANRYTLYCNQTKLIDNTRYLCIIWYLPSFFFLSLKCKNQNKIIILNVILF